MNKIDFKENGGLTEGYHYHTIGIKPDGLVLEVPCGFFNVLPVAVSIVAVEV